MGEKTVNVVFCLVLVIILLSIAKARLPPVDSTEKRRTVQNSAPAPIEPILPFDDNWETRPDDWRVVDQWANYGSTDTYTQGPTYCNTAECFNDQLKYCKSLGLTLEVKEVEEGIEVRCVATP